MRSYQKFGKGVFSLYPQHARSLSLEFWGANTGKLAGKTAAGGGFETDLHADPAVPGPFSQV